MSERPRSLCSTFHHAIELVGRRWAGAIVHVLAQGSTRFAGIRASVPDLTARMLTARLRELEAAGIVIRTVLPERPPRVEYSLSEMGEELAAVLAELQTWAHRWVRADVDPDHACAAAHDDATVTGS